MTNLQTYWNQLQSGAATTVAIRDIILCMIIAGMMWLLTTWLVLQWQARGLRRKFALQNSGRVRLSVQRDGRIYIGTAVHIYEDCPTLHGAKTYPIAGMIVYHLHRCMNCDLRDNGGRKR